MNSLKYSYIRTIMNGSCITDEILNRVFCLSKQEVIDQGITQWCNLDDATGNKIVKWINETVARVRSERLKYKLKARYWSNVRAKEGYQKAIQS